MAIKLSRAGVPTDYYSIERFADDGIIRGLDNGGDKQRELLGLLALGNIAEDQDDAENLSIFKFDGSAAVVNRNLRPVFRNQYRVIRKPYDRAFSQHLCYGAFNLFTCMLVYDLENICERMASRLFLLPTGQRLCDLVHKSHAPCGVRRYYGVA